MLIRLVVRSTRITIIYGIMLTPLLSLIQKPGTAFYTTVLLTLIIVVLTFVTSVSL